MSEPAMADPATLNGGAPASDKPELLVGAAFAAGLVTAIVLKRLGNR
ncbi:MAG TPA: hypothetical protein VKU35_06315 [Candidatus Limnocylindria bacterium]|nr:hypothetical protein [Candidatus Limnocylindria bacterium]